MNWIHRWYVQTGGGGGEIVIDANAPKVVATTPAYKIEAPLASVAFTANDGVTKVVALTTNPAIVSANSSPTTIQ